MFSWYHSLYLVKSLTYYSFLTARMHWFRYPWYIFKLCLYTSYSGLSTGHSSSLLYRLFRNSMDLSISVVIQFDSLCWYLLNLTRFYTPVWKTGRIMPWQCPSVCPSVRPSVRPRFPDFSSTCFEISIWNLVYTFSRWHDMSSLSCITIGSLWPSLQPKVGQTNFLQSWPHKSR